MHTCTHTHACTHTLSTQSAELVAPDGGLVNLVHKKIRLNSALLAWEHERFSLKKLPAGTLSSLQSHKDLRRNSTFVSKLVIAFMGLCVWVFTV